MELMDTYDRRIWRWWVMSDIIGKSNDDKIKVQSQEDDSESPFCATVHKELLCFYSPYYTAAIKGHFSESHRDLFNLRLNASQTRLFVEWLYTGRFERIFMDATDMYALYLFADRTDIIALRRSIMDSLARYLRRPTDPGDMGRLVSQLPSRSGLRRFLMEEALAERARALRNGKVAAWDWEQQGYVAKDFPEDFYAQLVNGHLRNGGKEFDPLSFSNACHYHEHEDGEEWKMTCGRNFVPRSVTKPQLAYLLDPSVEDLTKAKGKCSRTNNEQVEHSALGTSTSRQDLSRRRVIMATSVELKNIRAARENVWKRSAWNSEHVTEIIAGSVEMIRISSSQPDNDGKIFSAAVHKELLCFFSPYYTAALYGGFAETQRNTITMNLPYDRMAYIVSWLYSGNPITHEPQELFELYAFADEKMMLAFRRSIMTRLIQFHDPEFEHLDGEIAMPYVKRLPENSGLFRYLVDYWVGVWARTDYRTEMAEWDADGRIPRKFFYAALEKFASLSVEGHPRKEQGDHRSCLANVCNYHEHPNRIEWFNTCENDPPYKTYYTGQ
ncbi:hypothetical protein KCU61_g7685, partial [Aureobasidium melanogenum]